MATTGGEAVKRTWRWQHHTRTPATKLKEERYMR